MLSPSSGRSAAIWTLLWVVSLLMIACGAGTAPEGEGAKERTSAKRTTEGTVEASGAGCLRDEPSDALIEDARRWAEDRGIPIEEAIREAQLDECYWPDAAALARELKNKEAETFAGFWVEYEPQYRYVFLFTRDGDETISPYIKDEPYARFIETRSWADATSKELDAARKEADRRLHRLKISYASSTNIKKNRVEFYVEDKARFEATLSEAGVRLPEHVNVVESELCCLKPG